MSKEIKLPQISDEADSAQISEILVSVGDTIEEEQSIIAVETDKASVEVPATSGGKIKEIKVKEGDEISVGDVILILEDEGEEGDKKEEKDGENGEKEEAEKGKKEEEPKDEEEPKEEEEKQGEEEGKKEEEEDEKKEKDTEGEKKKEEKEDLSEKKGEKPAAKSEEKDPSGQEIPASPGVRRFAREMGVDIRALKGSGADGRISEEDVKSFVREKQDQGASTSQDGLPDFIKWGETERKPLSNIRKAVAKSTDNSWRTIPHVTQFDEAEISGLEHYLEKNQEKAKSAGGKLTLTAILTKIAGAALQRFPKFNASIDLTNMEVVYKKFIHIGIAADTDRGLLIPVVRDVGQKSVIELSVEIQELAEKARNQKLSLEEMQGGTFVISNLGGIGGTNFTPIIYHPQVAILGISRSFLKPVYVDEEFKPRNILPLSLSYDHRLIDGAEGARFLRWICQAIEDPFEALLG